MTDATLSKETLNTLIDQGLAARDTSYSPYSKFRVGAALLTEDGKIFQGCNVENASYGATICAERTAYVKAVSEGHTRFKALVVTTDMTECVSPCGICRQFISEFGPEDLPIYLVNTNREYELIPLKDLLPKSFSKAQGTKYLL